MIRNTSRILVVILVVLVIQIGQVNAFFKDVPVGHPYYQDILSLQDRGVIEEKAFFRPDKAVNRQEFIKFVLRNINYNPSTEDKPKTSPYADVPVNSPYLPYVKKIYEMGIGPNVDNFYPGKMVTKLEVLKTVLALENIAVPRYLNNDLDFLDTKGDSLYAAYVKKALELNIMEPISDQYFGLFKRITRGELAYTLNQIYLLNNPDYNKPKKVIVGDVPEVPKLDILTEVYESVVKNHIQAGSFSDKDKSEMMYEAIKAIVNRVGDQYSEFLTPEEADALRVTLDNELEGIGAYINLEEGKIIILSPVKGSPAEKAGLRAGDIITSINGENTSDMTLIDAVSKIKGPSGTKVELLIQRPGESQILKFVVNREKIKVNSVELVMDGDIAHVSISQFSADTNFDFKQVVEELLKKNPRGIVLDLRNNPGGYLDSAVYILGYFLPKQSLAVQVAYASKTSKYETTGKGDLKDYPLVLLGNEGSASASEIVIGALMELKKVKLVGSKTFGKGTVQELNFFDDGSTLKLTVAKWLTPEGVWINHLGFKPDVNAFDDSATKDVDEAYEAAKKEF